MRSANSRGASSPVHRHQENATDISPMTIMRSGVVAAMRFPSTSS
jgi:hypothetical protein